MLTHRTHNLRGGHDEVARAEAQLTQRVVRASKANKTICGALTSRDFRNRALPSAPMLAQFAFRNQPTISSGLKK